MWNKIKVILRIELEQQNANLELKQVKLRQKDLR